MRSNARDRDTGTGYNNLFERGFVVLRQRVTAAEYDKAGGHTHCQADRRT
jgi:hypothetical protein